MSEGGDGVYEDTDKTAVYAIEFDWKSQVEELRGGDKNDKE